ncbi:hypothetical protein R3P38DRAFT_3243366 [Favolaschia claudopus]|uniref:Major capsid protein n=1 Tax=Favolaschia claudopus TaxID=2862362 RepID=A0AAV9Z3D1_9AGAR
MDQLYFKDSRGDILLPVWNVNGLDSMCSFAPQPAVVCPRLMDHFNVVPYLLGDAASAPLLRELRYDLYAFWYMPQQHWLGYIPVGPPPSSDPYFFNWVDPLALAFSDARVPFKDDYAEGFGHDEDGASIPDQWCGYEIERSWVEDVFSLNHKLEVIWRSFVTNGQFYRKGRMPGMTGDLPNVVNRASLTGMLTQESEVENNVLKARLALRSQIGFISWLLTVAKVEEAKLSEEDTLFLASMRLEDRPKVGMVYNLSRDVNEINFQHLIDNNIPFHYYWTDVERQNTRYLRYSPEYCDDVQALMGNRPGVPHSELRVQDLRCFPLWRQKLEATDWNLRNLQGGKRGQALQDFSPEWDYEVVDEFGYGARPLYHWNVIRPYTERFKGFVHEGEHGTLCTLFRYNPITVDEPPSARPAQVHRFELTDFAINCEADYPAEKEFYYDSTTKNREPPRTFSPPGLIGSSITSMDT